MPALKYTSSKLIKEKVEVFIHPFGTYVWMYVDHMCAW